MVPVREYRGIPRRTPPQAISSPTRWLLNLQALALVAGAVAVVVLAATSQGTLSAGFVVTDVVAALALGLLLNQGPRKRWARTPIVLVELIAVLISFQVWASGRPVVAAAVGIPAVVAFVLLLRANRHY